MNRFLRTLPAAAVLFAAATPVLAHGHDHGGVIPSLEEGIVPMVVSLLVFGVVLAVLVKMVYPKISKGLADRENKIRTAIEEAEASREQAKRALEQYEKNLSDARAQAQKMIEQAMAQQQSVAAELKAKAEIELTAMRDRARRDIEAAKRAALAEIYTEASNLSTKLASKILRREVNAGDQQRLVDESLAELAGARNN